MNQQFVERIQDKLKKQRRKRLWKRTVSVLGIAVVICTLSELILPAMTLSDTAYCGIEEHTHEDACYNKTLNCIYEAHEHIASCYQTKRDLICTLQEGVGHVHNEACKGTEVKLTCGQNENSGHSHSNDCMHTENIYICGLEGDLTHVHTESCSEQRTTMICGLQESEGHTHMESCYTEVTTHICGKTEEAHTHNGSCWREYQVVICGKTECKEPGNNDETDETEETNVHESIVPEKHEHTDACYQKELICKIEEHKHEIRCFANPKADLETAADWEKTLPRHLSGDVRKDVVAIAQSQLGYEESDENYIVSEDDVVRGYTRYGQWYGNLYGDWCAMFVSFCLSYADADVPLGAACSSWIRSLKGRDMYREPEGYIPTPGDIVFFDWGVNKAPDHVGLVVEFIPAKDGQPAKIRTIEGNCCERVMYMTYNLNNPEIFGYGEIVPTSKNSIEGSSMKYEDSFMKASLMFPKSFEIPKDAKLSVKRIDSDTDKNNYEQMTQAVNDTIMSEEDKALGTLKLYHVEVVSNGKVIEIPTNIETTMNIEYKNVLYTKDQIKLAERISVVNIEKDQSAVSNLKNLISKSHSYKVSVMDAKVDNEAKGVTGFSFKSAGVPSAMGIFTELTVKTGEFWKRIETIDEIQKDDKLLIVSAEGNMALTLNAKNSNIGIPVILDQIKSHEDYYEIWDRADDSPMSESHKTSHFNVAKVSKNKIQLKCDGKARQYLSLKNKVFGTEAMDLNVEKTLSGNLWKLSNENKYLTFSRDVKNALSTVKEDTQSDVMIFRLEETSLVIPPNAKLTLNPPTIPEKPEYTSMALSDKSEGVTSIDGLDGVIVEYVSDKVTADILETLDVVDVDGGKLLADKSVVYGNDDFDAIESYEEGTFSVTLSAAGQATVNEDQAEPLLDVVIVLDTSKSVSNADNWKVEEINRVIDRIMQTPDNRVGLVTFSDTSQVALPLGRHTATDGQYLEQITDETLSGSGNTKGTFIQAGIQEAAKLLLNNKNTEDSSGAARQPVIILISDGGPTLCTSNYKSPCDGPVYGADINRYGISGYYTILTAQYYKNLVGSHYGMQTKFVTVGIGMDEEQNSSTDSSMQDYRYCKAVLNPTKENLENAKQSFDDWMDEGPQMIALLENTFEADYVSVSNIADTTYSNISVLPNPYTSYDYADTYCSGADDNMANDLISCLDQIQFRKYTWNNVVKAQTSLELNSPIGVGMEVKGEPILRFGTMNYAPTHSETVGKVTTYVYDYDVTYTQAYPKNVNSDNTDVTEMFDLSKITVTITTEGEGIDALQTVRLLIAEELLPVVYPEKYGKFYYQEEPLRLIYKAGLSETVIEDLRLLNPGESRTYQMNDSEGRITQAIFTAANGNKIIQQLDMDHNGTLVLKKDAKAVTAIMQWSDKESHDPIQMYLLADGEVVDIQEVSVENNWTYTWASLPKVVYGTNEVINYSVSENYVAGYTPTVDLVSGEDQSLTETFRITNTKSEEPLKMTIQNTDKFGTNVEGSVYDLYLVSPEASGAVQIPGTEDQGILINHKMTVGEDGLNTEIPREDQTYYLMETAASEGLELLDAPIKFAVKDEKITIAEANNMVKVSGNTIRVKNLARFELPAEEGNESTLFYGVGAILVLGSIVLFITKKRMDE